MIQSQVSEDREPGHRRLEGPGARRCCRPCASTTSLLFTMPYSAGNFVSQIKKTEDQRNRVTLSWSHSFLVTEAGFHQACLTPILGLFKTIIWMVSVFFFFSRENNKKHLLNEWRNARLNDQKLQETGNTCISLSPTVSLVSWPNRHTLNAKKRNARKQRIGGPIAAAEKGAWALLSADLQLSLMSFGCKKVPVFSHKNRNHEDKGHSFTTNPEGPKEKEPTAKSQLLQTPVSRQLYLLFHPWSKSSRHHPCLNNPQNHPLLLCITEIF